MVLCKDANFLLPALNLQWIAVIQYLMQSFLLCLGFLIAEAVMTGNRVNYLSVIRQGFKPATQVVLFLLFVVLFLVALAHAYFLVTPHLSMNRKEIVNFFISLILFFSVPISFFCTRYFFLPPLMMLEKCSFLRIFLYSQQLVRGNFFRVLRLFAVAALFCLFSMQGTLHEQLLAHSRLNVPFDFVLFLFVLPVLYSMTLILLEELKLREKK